MKKFVITLHFDVAPARSGPPVRDVLAPAFGPGHQFSLWAADTLTVIAEVRAENGIDAIEVVRVKTEALWPLLGAGRLHLNSSFPAPDVVRVGVRAPGKRSRLARRLTYVDSQWRNRPDRRFDDWPDDWPHDGDDFGGGVREPRRPRSGPPHLSAAAEVPPSGLETHALNSLDRAG